MQVRVFKDAQAVAKAAAMIFAAQLAEKSDSVLGLATGSTPVETYRKMIELYNEGQMDFSKVKSYNLDEYVGLGPEHECSYRYFMQEQLFNHINIRPENTFVPSGVADNLDQVGLAYDEAVRAAGGVDLQLLGIGNNGHIGFNEPDEAFATLTHCVDLQPSTIEANKRFFASADDVPKQAYTMGIQTIMQAKKVLMVVSGADKAPIMKEVLYGPVTPKVPASILQMHPDVTIVADEAALSLCDL